MLGGSFIYTWSADSANTSEKREWRGQHESKHDRQVDELKYQQKEIAEKIEKRYDDTQRVLQEILIETLAAKKAATQKRGNP